MSEHTHETLSAFIDGEIADDAGSRLLDKVLTEETLSRRWVSYHLIGDVMRRRAHLYRETDPVSPGAGATRVRAIQPSRAVLGPVAGLALAASVALVSILAIHALSPQDTGVVETAAVGGAPSQVSIAPVADAGAAAEPAVTIPPHRVTAAASTMRNLTRLTWSDAAPAVATRLNGYLVTHNEHLATGLRGMHPYARIVAYDSRGN